MSEFDFEKICDFQCLYRAYLDSRKGKRNTREVVRFEMEAGQNVQRLREELRNGTYRMSGYYHFTIHDPKVREIYALHYRDRVVQHSLCDNVLAPWFERHLIYDNAACRKEKGTLFAINRLSHFLHEHYRRYGTKGYFLKCDVRKFFDHIDHQILKDRLVKIVDDERTRGLLWQIIDSYEVTPEKGIPLGNQTSQWFALYYLDPLDRLVKEKLRVRYYIRYMDDMVLVSDSAEELRNALVQMKRVMSELQLEFNQKTQLFPIRNGVEYLGWRFSLTESGAVIRRIKTQSKIRWKHRLRKLRGDYSEGKVDLSVIQQSLQSYHNHMSYGNTGHLQENVMRTFVLKPGKLSNSVQKENKAN